MKVVSLIVGPVRVSGVSIGWVSCADTISSESSDASIAEFNSTVQVTVIEDATLIGPGGILLTDTEGLREGEKFMTLWP